MKSKLISKSKKIILSIINKVRPFYFDAKSLEYKRMNGWLLLVILLFSTTTFFIGWTLSQNNDINNRNQYDEESKLMLIKNGDKFSEDKLILFIKELNFRYPELVYAQARLESGDFNSYINIQNNNFFGMKKATRRINCQSGEQYGHAFYNSWRFSVLDYGMFAASFLSDFKTKEEYYQYIERFYSETPGYIEKVKTFEKQYFDKLAKIKAASSYDLFECSNDSVPVKKKQTQTVTIKKSSAVSKEDSVPVVEELVNDSTKIQ